MLQEGPFGSKWLRVGCVRRAPWHTLWTTLQGYVTTLLEAEAHLEEQKKIPHAVYVVVSLRTMQAIDFDWLAEKGFRFHHFREPGHGDSLAAANAPSRARSLDADQAKAEFVYYCWPGKGGTGSQYDLSLIHI